MAHLARTHDQRAADAVARIFELAADAHAASPGGAPIDTTIVIDHETFERELRRAAGDAIEPRPAPDLHPLPTDPDLPSGLLEDLHPAGDPAPQGDQVPAGSDERGGHPGREFRCETSDGHPVHPAEAFVNALTGRVRRAVIGWDGVVLDMSGRHKLFTGPVRHAIWLTAPRCFWPGCRVKHPHCQADHLDPRRNGGRTNPDNGGPACGMHNRLKEHGFTARRDERCRMHVLRPDGIEIQPWC